MYKHLREIGVWVTLPVCLSFIVYGFALALWPAAASRFFAALFQLDPYWIRPLHGWAAVGPGVLVWLAACYAAAAVGLLLARELRPEGRFTLRSLVAAASRPLALVHHAERGTR